MGARSAGPAGTNRPGHTSTPFAPHTEKQPMFRTLKDLFDSFTQPSTTQSPAARAHAVQLAAAVLLVEVVRFDAAMDDAERAAMVTALRSNLR
jgi:uncharacterized tellurite resistance protein B-like protein